MEFLTHDQFQTLLMQITGALVSFALLDYQVPRVALAGHQYQEGDIVSGHLQTSTTWSLHPKLQNCNESAPVSIFSMSAFSVYG